MRPTLNSSAGKTEDCPKRTLLRLFDTHNAHRSILAGCECRGRRHDTTKTCERQRLRHARARKYQNFRMLRTTTKTSLSDIASDTIDLGKIEPPLAKIFTAFHLSRQQKDIFFRQKNGLLCMRCVLRMHTGGKQLDDCRGHQVPKKSIEEARLCTFKLPMSHLQTFHFLLTPARRHSRLHN